ncbi:MAG: hypothetical protein ACJAQ2_001805, partial [Vicingaceae bacterium]
MNLRITNIYQPYADRTLSALGFFKKLAFL